MSTLSGKQSLLISLSEACNLTKQTFRDYTLQNINHYPTYQINTIGINYNHIPFIIAMLEDIFEESVRVDEIPNSTQILINDGLEKKVAIQLALSVFKLIISAISEYVPDIDFTKDGYRCDFCGEYDLMIAPAWINEDEIYNNDAEILNNDLSLNRK